MASLVWFGTTPGEPRSVPKNVLVVSKPAARVIVTGWAGCKAHSISQQNPARVPYDRPDLTARQHYLETARTLLRAAQTMTDSAIAGRLKVLADEYQRRCEQASVDDAAKALERSAAVNAERSWME